MGGYFKKSLSWYKLFLFVNLIVFIGYLVFFLLDGEIVENNFKICDKLLYYKSKINSPPNNVSNVTTIITSQQQNEKSKSKNLKKLREAAILMERKSIEKEMEGYQLIQTNNATASSKDLIMEGGGEPIRNVLCTSWRSGSSFVGAVLDSHPATFYHYEPLMSFGVKQLRSKQEMKDGLLALTNLLQCNISESLKSLKYKKVDLGPLEQTSRVWKYCRDNRELCLDPEFLSNMCKMFPFQSMKTTRMRLRAAKILLEDPKLNIRLLFLIRDPRGTIHSRRRQPWCQHDKPDCFEPRRICKDMVDDFREGMELRKKFPDRFLAIRFEDLSLQPFEAFRKIHKFFRLQFHPKVQEFINTHTTQPNAAAIKGEGNYRNSLNVPFHWREDFSGNFSLVEEIQKNCGEAMKLWGYKEVKEENLLLKFNPLQEPPWKEMLVNAQ